MTRRRIIALLCLATISITSLIVVKFVITPTVVFGDSMLPTLRPWDLCWMRRVRPYEPVRGDVLMFRTADDPPLRFIKRAVGLPGETIEIRAGQVFIDGRPLPEPYTVVNPSWGMPATKVGAGKVYVIGDNRDVAMDITVHGSVATRLVQARMVGLWRWRK